MSKLDLFLQTEKLVKDFGKLRAVNGVTLSIQQGISMPSSAPMAPGKAPILI